jgi:hypothetical protein
MKWMWMQIQNGSMYWFENENSPPIEVILEHELDDGWYLNQDQEIIPLTKVPPPARG